MEEFTPGGILKILLQAADESPALLAERYVDRDRTLVYKWLHGRATPTKAHVPGILRFVAGHTDATARLQIRTDIVRAVQTSALPVDIKVSLAAIEGFEDFVGEALRLAIQRRHITAGARAPAALPTAPAPMSAPASGSGRMLSVANLAFALAAAGLGGVLWNALNRLCGWPYCLGGSGNEPAGLPSAVWGMLAGLPVIVCAVLSLRHERPAKAAGGRNHAVLMAAYTAGCGAGAFLFYNCGLRDLVERMGMPYGIQESIIVFVYALFVAFIPCAIALLLYRDAGTPAGTIAWMALLPAAAGVCVVLCTWLINRPEVEVAGVRGLLVGFTMKLSMFLLIRAFLKAYPSKLTF